MPAFSQHMPGLKNYRYKTHMTRDSNHWVNQQHEDIEHHFKQQ